MMLELEDEKRPSAEELLALSSKPARANKENVARAGSIKPMDYEVTFETDEKGRKVEIRRYKPGKYPMAPAQRVIEPNSQFFTEEQFTSYMVNK